MLHPSLLSSKSLSGSNSAALKPQTPLGEPACSLVTKHTSWGDCILSSYSHHGCLQEDHRAHCHQPCTSLQSPGPPEHHCGRIQDGGTPAEPVMEKSLPSHCPARTQFGGRAPAFPGGGHIRLSPVGALAAVLGCRGAASISGLTATLVTLLSLLSGPHKPGS